MGMDRFPLLKAFLVYYCVYPGTKLKEKIFPAGQPCKSVVCLNLKRKRNLVSFR